MIVIVYEHWTHTNKDSVVPQTQTRVWWEKPIFAHTLAYLPALSCTQCTLSQTILTLAKCLYRLLSNWISISLSLFHTSNGSFLISLSTSILFSLQKIWFSFKLNEWSRIARIVRHLNAKQFQLWFVLYFSLKFIAFLKRFSGLYIRFAVDFTVFKSFIYLFLIFFVICWSAALDIPHIHTRTMQRT